MQRAAWRSEAMKRLAPPPAPDLACLQGVGSGEARLVFEAGAALGVREDVVARAVARWHALVGPQTAAG